MTEKPTISVLIPCYNEEETIASCIHSCLSQTRPPDKIVVVNDGSTDNTARVLESFKREITIVSLPTPSGNKSRAQEAGLPYITSDIVIMTDADTVLDPHFIEYIEKDFIEYPDLSVVAGYVKSSKDNLLTALRDIDYTIGQDVYKTAQASLNFILVIPGCAGAFKTSLFREGIINFEHDTLTEDLDFTYKLNKASCAIRFNRRAIVYTSDPFTLASYAKQMRRWYGGAWQNLKKHYDVIFKLPSAALILPLFYAEGLIFSVAFFSLPFINLAIFLKTVFLYICVETIISIYAAIRRKRWELALCGPAYLIFVTINTYIFIEQFIAECLLKKNNMVWFHPERSRRPLSLEQMHGIISRESIKETTP